ncbi:hypothetical protein Cgig2_013335 [Carnegiea gigantea]|uniref:Uncharacterized protein n=1 Tax=Carnegiea gigantea TaxID=171969 RepID=A0A9Q1GX16_9CARY|nr:hypothetical protein Cgig2_013335 [Carnegiea gigantea]
MAFRSLLGRKTQVKSLTDWFHMPRSFTALINALRSCQSDGGAEDSEPSFEPMTLCQNASQAKISTPSVVILNPEEDVPIDDEDDMDIFLNLEGDEAPQHSSDSSKKRRSRQKVTVAATDTGLPHLQNETDNRIVIQAVKGEIRSPWRIQPLVQDLRNLLSRFTTTSIQDGNGSTRQQLLLIEVKRGSGFHGSPGGCSSYFGAVLMNIMKTRMMLNVGT